MKREKLPTVTSWVIVAFATMILILMAMASSYGQGFHRIRDEYWGNSFPQHTPSYSNAIHVDTVNHKVYRYVKKQDGWRDETQTWKYVYFRDEILNPRKRVMMDSLNAELERVAETEGYQAVVITHNYIFCHPRGNSDMMPDGTQTYDRKNLQKAINWSQTQGRKLVTMAQDYYVNKALFIDKYNPFFYWEGGFARLVVTVPDKFAVIASQIANDNGDANLMVERKPYIENLRIKGNGNNQIGIEVGATYGANFKRIYGENLDWVIYCRFQMLTLIESNFATNCTNGWAFGIGKYDGATWSNSQSNSSRAIGNRFYGNTTGTAFLTEHSSGIIYEGNIIEGVKVGKAFEMKAPGNTVVKDWTIKSTHLELNSIEGAIDGAVYVNWAGGIVTVDKIQSGHPSILANMRSNPGYTQITISNVPWFMPKDGKLFVDNCCTSWKIINCDNQLYGTDLTHLFEGRVMKMACDAGSGYDSVCITPINR